MIVLKMRIKAQKNQMCKYLFIILLGFCTLTFISCERVVTSREYEEIVTSPISDPHDFMRNVPFTMEESLSSHLSWEVPDGWSEEKGSGMRLATLRDQNDSIECSIVSLGAQAGNVKSNVVRWMGQINADIPADEEFSTFLSRQNNLKTKGGFEMTIIDLSGFTNRAKDPSMIAAIAKFEDKTIFVKMTGNKKDVIASREQFNLLCLSLNHR